MRHFLISPLRITEDSTRSVLVGHILDFLRNSFYEKYVHQFFWKGKLNVGRKGNRNRESGWGCHFFGFGDWKLAGNPKGDIRATPTPRFLCKKLIKIPKSG